MPTEVLSSPWGLPLNSRRTFRFAFVLALALVAAYGLALPFPYFAPLFAILLGVSAAPPPAAKGLLVLLLVVFGIMAIGLIVTPLLREYAVTLVLVIALGLYLATRITIDKQKAAVGTFLTIGLTLIPAAGLASYGLAEDLISALIAGMALAVICQWVVYPFFPEDPPAAVKPSAEVQDSQQSHWIGIRTALIVLPPMMAAFSNPSLYLATIIKTTLLAQQGSRLSARAAGIELIGSTFLAGGFSILLWMGLKLWPSLWMFFLWILLFGLYIGSKLYTGSSRYPVSFWQNVAVTVLILLGPAVEDSANGKDVYQAFFVRFMLFVAVTLYAWAAIIVLEALKEHRQQKPLKTRSGSRVD